jgi:hypothetical protein
MVPVDHGSLAHAEAEVEKIVPGLRRARRRRGEDLLLFKGLEWNLPAADHTSVFVAPGAAEKGVLRE